MDHEDIIRALDNNNHEDMYLSDNDNNMHLDELQAQTCKKLPKPKSVWRYIKSAKKKIYKFYKYFIS